MQFVKREQIHRINIAQLIILERHIKTLATTDCARFMETSVKVCLKNKGEGCGDGPVVSVAAPNGTGHRQHKAVSTALANKANRALRPIKSVPRCLVAGAGSLPVLVCAVGVHVGQSKERNAHQYEG